MAQNKPPKLRRACDRCTEKKIKCDNQRPCAGCIRKNTPCHYSPAYKSTLKTIKVSQVNPGFNVLIQTTTSLQDSVPSLAAQPESSGLRPSPPPILAQRADLGSHNSLSPPVMGSSPNYRFQHYGLQNQRSLDASYAPGEYHNLALDGDRSSPPPAQIMALIELSGTIWIYINFRTFKFVTWRAEDDLIKCSDAPSLEHLAAIHDLMSCILSNGDQTQYNAYSGFAIKMATALNLRATDSPPPSEPEPPIVALNREIRRSLYWTMVHSRSLISLFSLIPLQVGLPSDGVQFVNLRRLESLARTCLTSGQDWSTIAPVIPTTPCSIFNCPESEQLMGLMGLVVEFIRKRYSCRLVSPAEECAKVEETLIRCYNNPLPSGADQPWCPPKPCDPEALGVELDFPGRGIKVAQRFYHEVFPLIRLLSPRVIRIGTGAVVELECHPYLVF
ncbi:hypothetical protein BJ085DRAFT_28808 [Dimargaris cristalligena]|uniref:Zn(2)-C6 fungal-type domain-containing protein n=1 Tax=Dimargaris cristalligena TaxID=215637 RepID=A0A4P9ZTU0_9FUNG|nr:hypothetical protein BJ085DRAFT_28808 [Dimargaris cristalligena]|eukprot:RKP36271.1 hypothetical protein BJ085DRAFT_28808 [Dimargaris cristalligena]